MPGKAAPTITANKDGTINVNYQPKENGVHEINLLYNEQQVEGLPFRCHVHKTNGTYITAYGDGLGRAASGDKVSMLIVGGAKDIDVVVDGPTKPELRKEQKGELTYVSYSPMSPGEYHVSIKYQGKPIHGSPFSVKVSGEGRKRSQLSLTATSEFNLGEKISDLTGIEGMMKTPGGSQEPILLKKMPDGNLGIAGFTPKTTGSYFVDVTLDGAAVKGSPFKIGVGDRQVCSAAKVKATGALKSCEANKLNEINLDVSDAGYGAISLSIEGPHRSDIEAKDQGQGKFFITYKPHEPGTYLINLRFGHDHITGSPFMVTAGGQPSGRVRNTVNKDIGAAQPTSPGQKCDFQLKIPGTSPLDMEATLTSPSGKTDLCMIADQPESLYDIQFTPTEEGVHTVSLKNKGLHISGSPFQYTVGKIPAGGTHKVEIGGPGLEKGEVGIQNEFNIYTREAGPGRLSVAVEGPCKAQMKVEDGGKGYTTVAYQVTEPGQYGIHVKYDDEHVPDSPARVYIAPESADAKQCTVHAIKDRGLEVGRPALFNVSTNKAKGELKGFVETPGGQEEALLINDIDRELYALSFMPRENGIYYVHVKLNEAHIPGSPFPMLAGKMGADPALVLAKGEGLEKGETGKACRFTVITTNAGQGTLATTLEGPSKCAIVCNEVDEGYEFTYTPMAPGDYLINVKYCNVTLAGCPTKAKITGAGRPSGIVETSGLAVETVEKKPGAVKQIRFVGDASKVTAKGPGIKKAFVNRPCQFNLDLAGAGNGILSIAMVSPSGHPVAELSYKKQRGTTYTITYKADEKGINMFFIRWGTDDIPGSPFAIEVS